MKKRILFLCVANSARSQLAEGLAKHYLGEVADVWSAGSMATRVHPLAIEVMQAKGIDITGQHSKSVEEFKGWDFDYVITLCADEVCPTYAGGTARHLHWALTDPAKGRTQSEQLATFSQIREELTSLIQGLKQQLASS